MVNRSVNMNPSGRCLVDYTERPGRVETVLMWWYFSGELLYAHAGQNTKK